MSNRFCTTARRTDTVVRRTYGPCALLAVLTLSLGSASAQKIDPVLSTNASLTLPDAPSFRGESSSSDAADLNAREFSVSALKTTTGSATRPMASPTQSIIQPGQTAPALTAGDKGLLGVRSAFSLTSAAGWFISAGWEQLTNGSPNYGTDKGAFGERLGAAAIRSSSEDILSQSLMANVFREDPRYYRMGPGNNLFSRGIYAATRPLITRTDSGHKSANLALLTGNLMGAALTNAYYPKVNRNAKDTMRTFGGSIGGAAIGDLVSEFFGDALHLIHLGHN